jgi:hypothetical protein
MEPNGLFKVEADRADTRDMSTSASSAPSPDDLTPCGYCRRCAIHDDPGGCITVDVAITDAFGIDRDDPNWIDQYPTEAQIAEKFGLVTR